VSSASLILTDSGLALSEPKAVGAQGSTKVLAASSLGSCLVFVSGAVVTVALAAIGRDMRLSPLDLQWVMNAELLPLAALTLVGGALGGVVRVERALRGVRRLRERLPDDAHPAVGDPAHVLTRRDAVRARGVLLVSSYLPELIGLCDRIAVMSRGRLSAPRPANEWTEHSLVMAASGAEVA